MAAKDAADADAAVAAAWAAYKPDAKWPLKVTTPVADRDGWTDRKSYAYQTSPNEKRDVGADVRRANDTWTVTIYDMAQAVGEKRGAQVDLIFGKLLPKGHKPRDRSPAGRPTRSMPRAWRKLRTFVETSMKLTGVPGRLAGPLPGRQGGAADGFGVRELGKPEKVDADTRYMIASNTKAMATLMLAKLVDEKKMGWDTPAVKVLPSFKLGDADITSQVLVKHLICACTGMPRQDLEWLLEFEGVTPERAMAVLGTMQPTSKFGELFQYSNPMAAAAGFIGGHVAFPALELGAAYDKAMQTLVFDPLGMTSTTHDFGQAQRATPPRRMLPTSTASPRGRRRGRTCPSCRCVPRAARGAR